MTDRRRRAALLLPLPATSPGAVLLRDRKSPSSSPEPSSPPSGSPSGPSGSSPSPAPGSGQDTPDAPDSPDTPVSPDGPDNPFAPPPADAPDQEWRPRYPASHTHGHGQGQGQDGNGDSNGNSSDEHPAREDGRSAPTAWGSQWSPRQPGRQSGGGFGTRPGGRNGQQNNPGGPGNLRWDPTDPLQRRARYALLAGMWAFFFALLFGLPEVSLLLGALAIYWGISSLRGKPDAARTATAATTAAMEGRRPATDAAPTPGRPPGTPPSPARPQATAAIAGLVTASLALMMVAATFTVQIVYRDYFNCVNDALTRSASKSCENLLPEKLRPLLSTAMEK
ncbi:integral membrane protein MviN [Streptomyces sp. NBRC 110611]|uniref:hypothetical protein n=1 Tax=Streptomyces sp. NBRC 110611 TaxID=1621259 RepID=UPI00082C7B15|nr:hypothetical protein [Streptomyces sp. NBRC 110611]GAU64974.1 integral membrane protein MviN [Streptomyces sp. NBRC 110611]